MPNEISLLVAWRRGQSLESGEIRVADDVAEHLASRGARDTRGATKARLIPYTPETVIEVGEAVYVRDDELVAFVRKRNPVAVARPRKIYALLGNALTGVERPVSALDSRFDLIVAEHGVIALDLNVFELRFRETDAVLARIPDWVAGVAEHLPLAGHGGAIFVEKARSNIGLRRRLRAIHERGNRGDLTIDAVRQHIRDLGMPEYA